MASIIFRPSPRIAFQQGSESFQSFQSRSQSDILELSSWVVRKVYYGLYLILSIIWLRVLNKNPIVVHDKDENDNRNCIAKLWENVQDLEEDCDNESAPEDLAQVLARHPSILPPKEDKEQDDVIENASIVFQVETPILKRLLFAAVNHPHWRKRK